LPERSLNSRLNIIFLLIPVILACSGLQVATATSLPHDGLCNPAVGTAGCHQVFVQPQPAPCCPSQACHQAPPLKRDLGLPEYHAQQKSTHPLAHEYRSFTPQFKAGEAIVVALGPQKNIRPLETVTQNPLQSQLSLRSVVLLH